MYIWPLNCCQIPHMTHEDYSIIRAMDTPLPAMKTEYIGEN